MSKFLKRELVKLAHAHPEFRKDLLPLIKKAEAEEAETEEVKEEAKSEEGEKKEAGIKVAAKDTVEFVDWVLMTKSNDKIGPKEMVKFFERTMGMEVQAPVEKRKGLRFQVGDPVIVDASKHKDGTTLDIYQDHNKKEGTVVSTEEQDHTLRDGKYGDVMVQLKDGNLVRFPQAQKSRSVGLLMNRPIVDPGGKLIEIVYISDKERKPTAQQVAEAQAYIQRGQEVGEERSLFYYSGPVKSLAMNRDGQPYFGMAPQQRMKYRSVNPAKGSLLYLGILGKRPSGWKKEFEALVKKIAERNA